MSRIAFRLRRLAVLWSAPICCGQPMQASTGIPPGWYCTVNPTHVI